MRRIRVLIVDDAVAVRRLVADVLGSDPAIEVVGTAASGRIALAKIPQLKPDLVTLDVEMPEMDGLQTLAAMKRDHPALPVIMFSTLTRRGAEATLDALSLGATDYVTKPSSEGGPAAALQCVRDELVERIRTFCASILRESGAPAETPRAAELPRSAGRPGPVAALAIGVSTGGPNALAALLPSLPEDLSIPVLIVQHMPALFTEMLASRLAQRSVLPIGEGVSGRKVEPGHVYIAPGDHHMTVERRGATIVLRTNQDGPENFCRPSVDVLFRSAAEVYGDGALAVVMTGMGQDGLEGCRRVREAGGSILVQDEATSVVWGMPGYVARAGLADAILPLDRIGAEIRRRLGREGAAGEGECGPRAAIAPAAATTRWR
jgi:two-component system chemotaxis response regulator CheB